MPTLATEHCTACRPDAPRLTPAEIADLLPQVPGWSLIENENGNEIVKDYRFGNFMEALAFTKRLGRVAERAGHHPAILTEWGHVRVTWSTHKIRGLHRNDFIMAARTDKLFASQDAAAKD